MALKKVGIAAPADLSQLSAVLGIYPQKLPRGLGGKVVVPLIEGLLEKGLTVSLYTYDMEISETMCFEGDGFRVFVAPFRKRHRMRDLMALERHHMSAMIEMDEPDLVNAHWAYECALGALSTGRPTLTTLHDWAPSILYHNPSAYRAGRLVMFAQALLHNRQRHLSAVNSTIAKRVKKWTGRDCRVIPDAILARDCVLRPPPLSQRPRVLAINQGFSRRKNVKTLLRAMPAVRADIPDATLVLVGADFEPGGPANKWARANELDRSVEFVGEVDHETLIKQLDKAAVLAHAAVEEAFGMVMLEAMARGLPVIAGRGVAGPEFVLDAGRSGLLVDPRSHRALARAISDLLGDQKKWASVARAGLDRAQTMFSAKRVTDEYISAYREVLT